MTRSQYDVVIVGGGIVGLATAYNMFCRYPSIRLLLLEKESQLAYHQSGHNSGVIHSGLYYKPGSLKARLCRKGYREMLSFCRHYAIPHDICGKVVVATDDNEVERLHALHQRGLENGLVGLRQIDTSELHELEPYCSGEAALWIPETGIVDYRAVALQISALIQSQGGRINTGEKVVSILGSQTTLDTPARITTDRDQYTAKLVVVCAGIQSDRIARQEDSLLPIRMIPFRGEYYQLKPDAHYLVNNLIYPVPDPAFPFLGVHFTRMVSGGVECGPNAVLALAREGYGKLAVDLRDMQDTLSWPGFYRLALRYWPQGVDEIWRSWFKSAFVDALRKLVPSISADDLIPGGSGIRAQACDREGNLVDDFQIREKGRVLYICNAPSPAATASFAIGQEICRLASERLVI
jgi:L-2-hydroxyglutarate oxidase